MINCFFPTLFEQLPDLEFQIQRWDNVMPAKHEGIKRTLKH